MNILIYQPLTKIAELIRSREVSPVEVAEAHLEQISRLNPALNAIIKAWGETAPAIIRENPYRLIEKFDRVGFAIADAIAAEFVAVPGTPFDEAAARCVADRMVRDFGVARLAAVGITADSALLEDAPGLMTEAEMELLADLLLDCVDFTAVIVEEMIGDGISRESAECITDAIAETELIRDLLLAGVGVGFDEDRIEGVFNEVLFRHFGTFLEAIGRCLTPEDLARILAAEGDPTLDPGVDPSARQVSVFELRTGDCFDDPTDLTQVVETVPVVDCSQPHDNEIYFSFDLPDGDFPGEMAVGETADERCFEEFEPFVGIDYFDSELDFFTITPTSGSWAERGDRTVYCAIYNMDLSKLEGSARGAGR